MLTKCLIVTIIIGAAYARSSPTNQNSIIQEEARSEDGNSFYGDMKFVYKVYQECATSDLSSCLKLKLITAMDRVARSYKEVPLFGGVTFVQDSNNVAETPVQTELELEASLPRSLNEREDALNTLIFDKITNFLQSHTLQVRLSTLNIKTFIKLFLLLQVKFPSGEEIKRSLEEARGKKKKMAGLLLIPLILGGTLIPLALGALALLAGKALIVSKLALVLAGIIGLKKLLTGSGDRAHETPHEVHVGSGHGSGWGRSYEKEQQQQQQHAQNLAYSAQIPKTR